MGTVALMGARPGPVNTVKTDHVMFQEKMKQKRPQYKGTEGRWTQFELKSNHLLGAGQAKTERP